MNRFLILAGIFLFTFFLSCKRNAVVSSLPKVDTTMNKDLDNFKVNDIDFTYFHFKSKVEYVSGSESQNFTVNGRIKKDSVIWLSITPGLGIEAARALILKDSVFILDRIHNKLYSYDFSYINSSFNSNINFYNLQALLVGNLAFPKQQTDKLVKQDDLGFFLFRQNREGIKVDNYIPFQNRKVETIEIQNAQSNGSLSLKYSDFAPLDSFMFANHVKALVRFVNGGAEKNTIIDVQHHKAEIVIKPLNFPFNVPKRFEEK